MIENIFIFVLVLSVLILFESIVKLTLCFMRNERFVNTVWQKVLLYLSVSYIITYITASI